MKLQQNIRVYSFIKLLTSRVVTIKITDAKLFVHIGKGVKSMEFCGIMYFCIS